MSQVKKFAMAGATFSAALGIGFAMQNGDAVAARFASGQEPAVVAETPAAMSPPIEIVMQDPAASGPALVQPAPSLAEVSVALPDVQPEVVTLDAPSQMAALGDDLRTMPGPNLSALTGANTMADAPLPDLEVAAIEVVPAAPAVVDPESPLAAAEPMLDCSPVMSAVVGPAAMVDLTLDAPCNVSAEFVLHHQGMMITGVTDVEGHAQIAVPALGEKSVFIAAFADQSGAMAAVDVPEMANFDRAVLQWQGDAGMQMQVYEFGADYASDGHVSAQSPRDVSAVSDGKGFMVELGAATAIDAPYRAQVYTYPAGAGPKDGTIQISAEAVITDANCGRDIAAQSIQVSPGSEPIGEDLTMTMPACDGIGDFLVLNSMFEEFAVASN